MTGNIERDKTFYEIDRIYDAERKRLYLILKDMFNDKKKTHSYFERPLNGMEAYFYYVGETHEYLHGNIYEKMSPVWIWLNQFWDHEDYHNAYSKLYSLDRIWYILVEDDILSFLVIGEWSDEALEKIKDSWSDDRFTEWSGIYIGSERMNNIGTWYKFTIPEEFEEL